MSLAWDPNSLDANKRALEAAMADEELMREISYLERDLEQKQREIRAEAFAREHAKDIPDYEELKTCYLKTLEEFSVSANDGQAGGVPRFEASASAKRGGFRASGSLRIIIFWSILGAGIAALAGYMIARLVG